jgi:hypothetical protein
VDDDNFHNNFVKMFFKNHKRCPNYNDLLSIKNEMLSSPMITNNKISPLFYKMISEIQYHLHPSNDQVQQAALRAIDTYDPPHHQSLQTTPVFNVAAVHVTGILPQTLSQPRALHHNNIYPKQMHSLKTTPPSSPLPILASPPINNSTSSINTNSNTTEPDTPQHPIQVSLLMKSSQAAFFLTKLMTLRFPKQIKIKIGDH